MRKKTLRDIVMSNFEDIKRINDIKRRNRIKRNRNTDKGRVKAKSIKQPFDINSLLNFFIKNTNNTNEAEEKKTEIEDKDESPGGYGTTRRSSYGVLILSYTDYGKLFSYLGKFRSKSPYEDFENPTAMANKILDDGNKFFFLDREVIDDGMRLLKYFTPTHKLSGDISPVPLGNINSKDWEMFKLWKQIEPVMYNLKMTMLM